ncbi:tRNA 4-thiouridine(8) synthase ThiI [Treponema zuelzerae]|uniref:Probable tRNA sulfurtransferase n=1 Tax=Teretinema zuelzerae TaxID=156 RepID=A0AAE3EJ77_9SPIR|nr:tRNA uracil 4-sulfurtransferase ThiI [Teretinema zuelzerae]MCD1654783.1 tRNA 4-thiouridine(8) synthase ThiI [Teretinema zuelzerae]
MENAIYLVKVGELTLKSGNIKDFEQRLVQNTRLYLEGKKTKVQIRAGRMYVEGPEDSVPSIEHALTHLVGIAGWARARVVPKDIQAIREAVVLEALDAKKRGVRTFKVEARRSDKQFPLNSYEIARLSGEAVYDKEIMAVDVHKPDMTIRVELRERCFVYGFEHPGHRGLPCGTGGKGLLLLSGGIDSPVAGFRMLKRGMKIDCLYFHSHPYTSPEAQQKVESLAKRLAIYGVGTHLNIVPFTEVQQCIRDNSPPDYATVMLRMAMMKVANMLCRSTGAKAIITGESLGQVASQTIENLSVTNSCADFPVLRPLIGLDKEEIIQTAKEIGTYEISILPYEDCCVLFSPKHPVLKAQIAETTELFNKMNIESLLEKAFAEREHKRFGWKSGDSGQEIVKD